MILRSLAGFARREGLIQDPCFQFVGVSWAIDVGPGGEFRAVYDLRTETGEGTKKRRLPRQMLLPARSKRTAQDRAEFLADKAEYVLGLGERNPAQLEARRVLFLELMDGAARATGEADALAVTRFLESAEEREKCAAELTGRQIASNDVICFRRGGRFLQDDDALRAYWREQRSEKATGEGQCLVCGERAAMARLHPNIKPLAGASTSGVPIVSVNAGAFESYGWEGNGNAPVCKACAAAYTTAINRCLTDQFPDPADADSKLPRQSRRLSENLTAVYWSDDSRGGTERLADAVVTDPEVARAILEAPWQGGGVTSAPLRFHCLLLQGAQGRATVRAYVATTIEEVRKNIGEWLAETDVGEERAISLVQILAGLALRRKLDELAPNLSGELYLAVLFGRPIALNAAQAAVSRNRAEGKVLGSRAALLQAWLNRKQTTEKRRALVSLDCEHPSCGYQLGRLLAVCDAVQYGQRGGSANKTVVDRYFAALSTRPRYVFPRLMQLTELHLAKLRKQGQTFWRLKVGEVVDRLPASGLPAQLNLEEQALFALGFYHQQMARFDRSKRAGAPGQSDSDTDE